MERTFSVEYEEAKCQKASSRQNKKKHGAAAERGYLAGHRAGRRETFSAEHGSSAAQKMHDPDRARKEYLAAWHQKPRCERGRYPLATVGQVYQTSGMGIGAAVKEQRERRLSARKPNKASKTGPDVAWELAKDEDLPEKFRPVASAPFWPEECPKGALGGDDDVERRIFKRNGEPAVAVRREAKPKDDARKQRAESLGKPDWPPSGLEQAVRTAAEQLRRLAPGQRPSAPVVFLRWLRHHKLQSVKLPVLMTPGALVKELLPLLGDLVIAEQAVGKLAQAPPGVDDEDEGPLLEHAEAAAARARRQIRHVSPDHYQYWPISVWARWLCSQCYVEIPVSGSDVLQQLRKLGVLLVSGEAKISYDEETLKRVEAPCAKLPWDVQSLLAAVDLRSG